MRQKAFSLVEILVVMAIIAVLAAILLPVLLAVRGRALQTTCTSNLRQLYVANELYGADNDDLSLPLVSLDSLSSYVDDTRLYACPAETAIRPNAEGLYPLKIINLTSPELVPYKISYAYLGDYLDGNTKLYGKLSELPNVGLIACQWHGPLSPDASGSPALKYLQPRKGAIVRVCFDGHVAVIQRKYSGSVTTNDLFYRPNNINEALEP